MPNRWLDPTPRGNARRRTETRQYHTANAALPAAVSPDGFPEGRALGMGVSTATCEAPSGGRSLPDYGRFRNASSAETSSNPTPAVCRFNDRRPVVRGAEG